MRNIINQIIEMKSNLLLKNCMLVFPNHEFNGQKIDIEIIEGKITQIGKNIPSEIKECIADQYISPGWFDMKVNFCDPGFEHKEDIQSGSKAAISGGFTGVATFPELDPVSDNKSQISYQISKSQQLPIQIIPIGALSVGMKGTDMAELYDMYTVGAKAFTDGEKTSNDSGLLMRALQYTQVFHAPVIIQPNDKKLSQGGKMHEGLVNVTLGLKGIPDIAETADIQKCLEILRYTGGELHFSKISTPQSVELIKQAKKEGLKVTADVSIHHLILTDEALTGFDTNYKFNPPLRPQSYIKSLIEGLNNGTIDCIVSDHKPEDTENKEVEFDYAKNGCIGTQLLYSIYQTFLSNQIDLDRLIQLISINPRKILNLEAITWEIGSNANITIFNPNEEWKLTKDNNLSKSYNTPFDNQIFKGKVIQTIYNS